MNIILIDPPGAQEGLNVGLGYLAASLHKAGHRVKVLDVNNNKLASPRMLQEIAGFQPKIAGISVKSSTFFKASRIAEQIRKQFPNVLLVAGGPHVSLVGRDYFNEDSFSDYGVLGEGEEVLPKLCGLIKKGDSSSLDGVIKPDSSGFDRPVFVQDLDAVPQPDYSKFTGIQQTLSKTRYPVITSRGCPYNCIYCSVCVVSGKKWRARSLDNVIKEISKAKKQYEIKAFEVLDDNFTLDIERAKEFCRMLIKRRMKLAWSCPNGIRTDRVDRELTSLMRRSGCDLVMVGVESGDEDVFNTIEKGESLHDVEKGIRTLKNAGIRVGGYFIIGLPGDSIESTKKSVEFAKKTKLDVAHFNMLVPYPKTKMWDWVAENGRMLEDYRLGRHFLGKPMPVFETDDFTAEERVRAHYMANTMLRQYEFIIPPEYSRVRRMARKLMLLGEHDRSSLVSYLTGGLKRRLQRELSRPR